MNNIERIDLIPSWHIWSEQHREIQAQAEHLRVLLGYSIFLLLGNIAGSATLLIGLWTTVEKSLLIAWVAVMLVLNVVRWFVGQRFPTGSITKADTQRWERRFIASVAISGVLWGMAGSLFYVPGQIEHNLFLTLLIVAMCSAATASLSYHRIAYPVFLLPAITPITLHLILDNELLAKTIGFVTPFYFILLYLLSRQIYQTAHESILSRINCQYQAMFDYLTGVANRRTFEEAINREWYRAIRDKRVLSLVIADIDDFKLCNDTYGHATGDRVLKAVAALFEKRIRRGADLVARIGGEEFAIILPSTDLDGAVALAENIRVGLQELANSYHDEIPDVTMSFGVASVVPDSSLSPELLFKRADDAAYQAKRKGKDRVETMDAQ